jgi:hypothetical protein
LLLRVDDVGREIDVEQRRSGRKRAGMLVLIAVGGDEVGAIGCAIDGDFAAGAAADGADGLTLRGTEARAFSFLTDWTGQYGSVSVKRVQQNTLSGNRSKAERPEERRSFEAPLNDRGKQGKQDRGAPNI